ncbi:Fe-S cluster assembly protein SufD [uncultured Cytophaga sp.]|uniref:Fe-S cluster assembly protein SufD n=1 Tax=uncultured Cytophaga sp. TaxID=160238 RepID=UPI002628F76D|nr:Fe-S cluster assembly protein SufD [uncultured Cytophaga sp.]
MTTELKESLIQQFNTLEKTTSASLLADTRKEAISAFQQLGFPTTKHEEWKYTNLKTTLAKPYAIESAATFSAEDLKALTALPIDCYKIIFVNGIFSPSLSTIDAAGVTIESFQTSNQELVQKYFGKNLPYNDSMVALNIAFATTGTLIHVKAKQQVDKPIVCFYLADVRNANVFAQPSVLIVVEEAANAIVVELNRSLGSNTAFTNAFTHAILKKDAYLEQYKIQNDIDNSNFVHNSQLVHEGKSNSYTTTITLNGGLVRNNLNVTLAAEYCEAYLNGLYLEKGSQHVDNHTLVDHAMPNCYSNELYKGILDGKSTGVFNGKIWVRKDAQKTNAFQSNKNILLSKDASVNTKPQLEIYADDVKCSHGATTGQLDPEAMFYLRARGVGEDTAKKMLVHAIAFDVLEKVKHDELRAYLEQEIEARLK